MLTFYTRTAAKGLIYNTQTDRILVVTPTLFFDDEHVDLPGGGVKRSETPQKALYRELSEEIQLSPDDIQNCMEIPTPKHPVRWHQYLPIDTHLHLFWLTVESEQLDLYPNWEIRDIRWVRSEDLYLLLHPVYKEVLGFEFFKLLID